VTRPALWRGGAVLAVAFAVVLAVPPPQRATALFAFLLLAGALALALLVALVAARAPSRDVPLAALVAAPSSPPADLETFERDVRELVRSGAIDDRLRAQIQAIAAMRLARAHGIDLHADPAAAAAIVGDGPLWRLLTPTLAGRARVRLSAAELGVAVDALEGLR
jgi:hypothetical protein